MAKLVSHFYKSKKRRDQEYIQRTITQEVKVLRIM